MKKITAKRPQPLHIGMQGEHLACEVVFPEAAHWREEYGDGVFSLWHRRPNETVAYPCVVREENGEILWAVTSADTQIASGKQSTGSAELQYTVGETIVRSNVYATVIHPSITGETTDAPEPAQAWVSTVLQAAERAETAAQSIRTPVKGTDYWTEEDKAAMVQDVIAALPVYDGEVV